MRDRALLVANRGEIALRVIRSARELGFTTLAVRAEGDPTDRHAHVADTWVWLPGSGPAAYLDITNHC